MRTRIRAGLVAGLLIPALAGAARAGNPVAQEILKLHLSPQQLLSVRDFLGPFPHGIEIEASGGGAFVLRDDATMAYAGGFSLRVGDDGRVIVEKVNGAATIDSTRVVAVPLRLDHKTQASVLAALEDSQAVALPKPKEPAEVAGVASAAPAASIPREELPAVRLVNAKAQGTIQESRAVFFRDGSGFVRSVRGPVIPPAASPSLNVTDRYYSPIQGDGTKLWRGAVVEIEADLPIGVADLESRYGCAPGAECKPPRALTPVAGVHVIKWSRALVASVPPQLLAQISAPPAASPAPADPAAIAPTQPPAPPAASQTN